jgi:hypothetical protein
VLASHASTPCHVRVNQSRASDMACFFCREDLRDPQAHKGADTYTAQEYLALHMWLRAKTDVLYVLIQ